MDRYSANRRAQDGIINADFFEVLDDFPVKHIDVFQFVKKNKKQVQGELDIISVLSQAWLEALD